MGNFIMGLKVTAIGFSTVVLVLIVLMGIIMLQGKILGSTGKKPEATPKAATPAPQAAAPVAKQDDGELIAVIAAAIAACGGSTKAVKSITRVNGTAGAAWSAASRADSMTRL